MGLWGNWRRTQNEPLKPDLHSHCEVFGPLIKYCVIFEPELTAVSAPRVLEQKCHILWFTLFIFVPVDWLYWCFLCFCSTFLCLLLIHLPLLFQLLQYFLTFKKTYWFFLRPGHKWVGLWAVCGVWRTKTPVVKVKVSLPPQTPRSPHRQHD